MLSRISVIPRFNYSSTSFIHTCSQYCLTERNCMILTLIPLTWSVWWVPNNASKRQIGFNSAFKGLIIIARKISGFIREVDENCALLGYYASSSGNSLPTFWYNLSILSSVVKNPSPLKMGPINFPEKSVRNYQYLPCNSPAEHRTRHSMNKAWFRDVTCGISVLHVLCYYHNFFLILHQDPGLMFFSHALFYSRQSQGYLSTVSASSLLPSQYCDRDTAFSKASSPNSVI